jgi:hypothetical protein
MKIHRHNKVRKLLDRHFVHGAQEPLPPAVRIAVQDCLVCKEHYHRYTQIEAAMEEGGQVPSISMKNRVLSSVMQQIDRESRQAEPLKSRFGLKLAFGSAMIAGLLLLTAVFLWKPTPRQPTILVPRGQIISPDSQIGIRVFQFSDDTVQSNTRLLSREAVIGFSYTNLRDDVNYLVLLAVQMDGDLTFYYKNIPIKQNVIDEPLEDGFELAGVHSVGPLRFISLFSAQPLELNEISQQAKKLQGVDYLPETMKVLSLSVNLQEHSLLFEMGE